MPLVRSRRHAYETRSPSRIWDEGPIVFHALTTGKYSLSTCWEVLMRRQNPETLSVELPLAAGQAERVPRWD